MNRPSPDDMKAMQVMEYVEKLEKENAYQRTMIDNITAEYNSLKETKEKLENENKELQEYKMMYEGLCK